jgi:hypothetical protein
MLRSSQSPHHEDKKTLASYNKLRRSQVLPQLSLPLLATLKYLEQSLGQAQNRQPFIKVQLL